MHVRLNQSVEDHTKWICGPPQMVSRDYHVWVAHMDSEMLDRTFSQLCAHYQKRPGNEELLLAPMEQTAYGTMWTQVILAGPPPSLRWDPARLFVLISADKMVSVVTSFMRYSEELSGSLGRPLPDDTWTVFAFSDNGTPSSPRASSASVPPIR